MTSETASLIDAHVHICRDIHHIGVLSEIEFPPHWDNNGRLVTRPEPARYASRPSTVTPFRYTADMLLAAMDACGIAKAVLLQGPVYGDCNADVAEAVARHPDRLAGAAYLDPWSPDWRANLDAVLSVGGFRALKLECSESSGLCALHPDARLDAPSLVPLWAALERHGLALVLDLGAVGSRSYQTGAVRRIAREHPALTVVICHLAQPSPAVESDSHTRRLWEEQLDLGRLPGVHFDTGALPVHFRQEGAPYPTAQRFLLRAVDRIGPEKLLWGTDMPGAAGFATHRGFVDLARAHLAPLPPSARRMVLSDNALRVYFSAAPACPREGDAACR